ncbi:unnamed protein product [Enterobius vermicularis]|uniref:Dynein light chain n=1 Tax=Enterobius vermicularis TaxID=51028 RepID=A0A0N4VF85_ENTVE|nr:unnamed protein product [Enterobius vermicularis]
MENVDDELLEKMIDAVEKVTLDSERPKENALSPVILKQNEKKQILRDHCFFSVLETLMKNVIHFFPVEDYAEMVLV